jgi:ATP-dependent protease ClpP protease subunit
MPGFSLRGPGCSRRAPLPAGLSQAKREAVPPNSPFYGEPAMTEIDVAKIAWRRRWAARQRRPHWGAPAAAHGAAPRAPEGPAPQGPAPCSSQGQALERAEPVDEAQADRAKARWRAQHCWRTAPADIDASLDGPIDDAAVDRVIGLIGQDPAAPVFLAICSAGGDPHAALRAYDALRARPAPVTCHVSRQCSSAAIMLLLAGDVRRAAPQARFTLHNCAFEIPRLGRHSAALLRDNAAALDEVDAEMAMIIAVRSRYALWQLRADMAEQVTLDAHTAWQRGLLTQPPT